MKITAFTAMMLASAGPAAFAASGAPPVMGAVTICAELVPGEPAGTEGMTSSMFARIGVKLVWRGSSHCPPEALRITVSQQTPKNLRPGALAYALPFEGTHIVVFWDRIHEHAERDKLTPLLAHVLAHEITHILQGVDHHSQSGLMKANWDLKDFQSMGAEPLLFTKDDVDLIYGGLARRQAMMAKR